MKIKILVLIGLAVSFAATADVGAQKKSDAVKPGDTPRKVLGRYETPRDAAPAYGPYSPNLNSIRRHKCPEWFRDAKLGMFIDWGIYSVPGWAPRQENGGVYPDGYLNHILTRDADREYHEKTWGKDFMPDDFIPMFTAENFRAEELMRLAAESGMKYVVPFCKHHDGFCLWPSSYTGRNALEMGPRRDLVRPMVEECNRLGLKFGFYFSVEEWRAPVIVDGEKKIRVWNAPLQPWDNKEVKKMMSGKYFVEGNFFDNYIVPQAKEFINMYDPDILWFDGEWDMLPEELRTTDIIAHFFNKAEGRKEVALNDRFGQVRDKLGDFFCSEYHSLPHEMMMSHPWEENRSISQSFGYNREDTDENVLSPDELIDMFTRIVSENGNLLLMINLDGTGALPEIQASRLRELGAWLKVNGEAIYGSRPWRISNQDEGKIRFTQSKDGGVIYVICTDFPKDKLLLNTIHLNRNSRITMLGAEETELEWNQPIVSWAKRALEISIPDELYAKRKNEHAWVFKLELN